MYKSSFLILTIFVVGSYSNPMDMQQIQFGPELFEMGPSDARTVSPSFGPELKEGPEQLKDGPEQLKDGPEQLKEGPEQLKEGPEQLKEGPEQLKEGPEPEHKEIRKVFLDNEAISKALAEGPKVEHEERLHESEEKDKKQKRDASEENTSLTEDVGGIFNAIKFLEKIITPILALLKPITKLFEASGSGGIEE